MKDLIEKLEAATYPDRRLDEEIYRAVVDEFAPSFKQYKGMVWGNASKGITVLRYTASIDEALTLRPKGADIELYYEAPEHRAIDETWRDWLAQIGTGRGRYHIGKSNFGAIAICIAALKARQPAAVAA